ncbi:MAG: phosphotransferase [Actinomycetota bacterium]|nr:phosphotransferase [Actinomycetota bacterium]
MADGEDRTVDARTLTRQLGVRYPGVEVAAVQVLTEDEGSASRLRLSLEYAPGKGAGLPASMFLKRNLAAFNFPGEMYSTEVRIYRDVLDGVDIERPQVYAIETGDDDLHFTILMEDLGQRPGARLGIVTQPTTVDEVAGLLDTIAALHAEFWESPRLDNELTWLQAPMQNTSMAFWRRHGPRLARRHMEKGHRAALVDRAVWTDDRLWAAFDAFLLDLDSGPHTLLHGDVHAGNVYYVDGTRGGLIDWQLALRGNWGLDVTYLLTTALDPEQQAAHEADLLRHYLGRLAAHGVAPPDFEAAWTTYRRHVIYGVAMWLITPDGVHTDEAQLGYLSRCLEAAHRLRTLAALGQG